MARPYTRHSADLVFQAIVRYKMAHDGASPTLQEVRAACDITSTSTIYRLLRQLVDEGRIRIPKGASQGIEVAGGKWTLADPAARFPRQDASCRCDICGRLATWTDGECAYCGIHEPL